MDWRPGVVYDARMHATPKNKQAARATLKDIARIVGVSPTAVSQALNGKGKLTDDLRARVKKAAAQLGYSPNPAARILRGANSGVISVIINYFNNPFFRRFLEGLEDVTDGAGVTYSVSQTRDVLTKERELVRKTAEHGTDGIILLNCSNEYKHLQDVSASFSVPVVLISHTIEDRFAAVQADNIRGGRLAAEHLLGLDDRPIFHIAGPLRKSGIVNRKIGFMQALGEARPGVIPEACCFEAPALTAAAGYGLMDVIRREHRPPFGLFVTNDEVALGVLTYCRHHSLSLPRDVAVVGFSDIDLLETLDIPLTSIRIPQRRMGETAARTLLDLIAHPEHRLDPPITTLPVTLIVRESTAGPAAKGASL